MSLLPDSLFEDEDEKINKEIAEDEELPLLKEYGIDFSTGQLTGQIVEGLEAIKVWLWILFNTERYVHGIYTWDFGHELRELIKDEDSDDEEFLQATGEEMVLDALSVNNYITDSEAEITKDKDILNVKLRVSTVYGDLEVDYDV